ncbi:hypothetical protein J4476_00505 [Candidatus Woesearchaeota archaeon]|nr:MAG: hypothetical protein QT09_C0005G0010 [archaeon GW2011_AR18]MBS3161164.1 hypothetical protein [Candidatus Woesearchaeota archaeon]HIH25964.1 hypothetical protein [Nanoarchaeota archaeon]
MEKILLKKNRLDMEYKFESQKAIILYTLGTITLITFLVTMIIQKYYLLGIIGFIIISISSRIFYIKIKNKLDDILNKIENLN